MVMVVVEGEGGEVERRGQPGEEGRGARRLSKRDESHLTTPRQPDPPPQPRPCLNLPTRLPALQHLRPLPRPTQPPRMFFPFFDPASMGFANAPPTVDETRVYTAPPARLTLLDRVLALEKVHHLRCALREFLYHSRSFRPLLNDPGHLLASCLFAPSTSDPSPAVSASALRRTLALTSGEVEGQFVVRSCDHVFHPQCLRSGVQIEGNGVMDVQGDRVTVACPIRGCSGVGWVSKARFEEEVDEEAEEVGGPQVRLLDLPCASTLSSPIIFQAEPSSSDDLQASHDLDLD